MTPRRRSRPATGDALSLALERAEWERAALCLLIATAHAVRCLPDGAINELLAVLAAEAPAATGKGAADDR